MHLFVTFGVLTSVTARTWDSLTTYTALYAKRYRNVLTRQNIFEVFLISNFRRVLYVVCFLLGNSPASEFICRRFGTLCLFHLHR